VLTRHWVKFTMEHYSNYNGRATVIPFLMDDNKVYDLNKKEFCLFLASKLKCKVDFKRAGTSDSGKSTQGKLTLSRALQDIRAPKSGYFSTPTSRYKWYVDPETTGPPAPRISAEEKEENRRLLADTHRSLQRDRQRRDKEARRRRHERGESRTPSPSISASPARKRQPQAEKEEEEVDPNKMEQDEKEEKGEAEEEGEEEEDDDDVPLAGRAPKPASLARQLAEMNKNISVLSNNFNAFVKNQTEMNLRVEQEFVVTKQVMANGEASLREAIQKSFSLQEVENTAFEHSIDQIKKALGKIADKCE
jgi:hypothetical protein